MKRIAYSLMMLVVATFIFTSCEDVPSPFGTVTPPNTSTDSDETTEIKGTGTVSDPFNIAAIIAQCNKLASGEVSEQAYYFKGKVSAIAVDKSGNAQNFNYGTYGNASFYISDDGTTTNQFYCYRVLYLGNKKWTEGAGESLKVGDDVIVCAKLTNYNGTLETQQNEGYLYSLNGKTEGGGGEDPSAETIGTKENPLTVAQALEQINALADKGKTASKAYVKGKVVKVTTNQTNFEKYGNLNYLISDDGTESNTVTVYSGDGLDGAKFTSITDLAAGDEVIVFGTLYKYVNNSGQVTPEIDSGNYLVSLVKGSGGSTTPTGEPKGSGTLDDPFNVVAIAQEAAKLGDKEVSTQDYYFKGKICSVKYTFNATQGTANFNLSDDGSTNGTQFVCYSVYYLGNQAWVDGNTQIKVGDEVIIFGKITNYSGTLETSSKKAYIYSLNGNTEDTGGGDTPGGGDTGDNTISAAFGDLDCSDIANIKLSDGTIISLTQEGGKNPPIYHASSKMIRIYAQNAITINAGSKKIAKVEFAFDGTYGGNDAMYGEAGSNKITPTKENNIATFSNVNNSTLKVVNDFETNSGGTQFRTSKITITYAE